VIDVAQICATSLHLNHGLDHLLMPPLASFLPVFEWQRFLPAMLPLMPVSDHKNGSM